MTGPDDAPGLDALRLELPETPELDPRVSAAVGDAPRPVRPIWPTWLRFALAAGAGAGVAGLLLVREGHGWMQLVERGPPSWWWAVSLVAWVGGALVLTWMAVLEAEPRAPVRATSRVVVLGALAVVFSVLAVLADGLGVGAGSLGDGARCLGFGSLVEVAPVLVLCVLLARGMPLRPLRAGVLAGVAAAGWANLVLAVHCPSLDPRHTIPFHLGLAVVWALVGAGIGLWLAKGSRPGGLVLGSDPKGDDRT